VLPFVADGQLDTYLRTMDVFGAHPLPTRSSSSSSTAPVSIPALAPTSSSSSAVAQSTPGPLAPRFADRPIRFRKADTDECVTLACHDAECPPPALLQHIQALADAKLRTALLRVRGSPSIKTDPESHASESQAPDRESTSSLSAAQRASLAERFDATALVAVAVLAEELVREAVLQWYQRGAPLPLDARTLRTAALAQMNGAPDPALVSTRLLQNRLEALFNRDLSDKAPQLEIFRKVALLRAQDREALEQRAYANELNEQMQRRKMNDMGKPWDAGSVGSVGTSMWEGGAGGTGDSATGSAEAVRYAAGLSFTFADTIKKRERDLWLLEAGVKRSFEGYPAHVLDAQKALQWTLKKRGRGISAAAEALADLADNDGDSDN